MIGTLLQPFTTVTWGGETLHSQDVGGGVMENMAQNVKVSIDKTEKAPTASFDISATPPGFALFSKLKNSSIDKPIEISYGYPNGSIAGPFQYRFAGCGITTGNTPKLSVQCTTVIKGSWTDNKVSYTMEEPISLAEFPEFLKKKGGKGAADLNFVWKGDAQKVASKVMIKGNQMQRTPHVILTDIMSQNGIEVSVGDNVFDGTIILSYNAVKAGESKKDPASPADGSSEAAKRKVYVIGPGLMLDLKRTQSFNSGGDQIKGGSSAVSPPVAQVDNKGIADPQQAPPGQETSESSNPEGTSGQNNPGSSNSAVDSSHPTGDSEEAMLALSKAITTTISFTVPMLPYITGIKSRDFIVIPALDGSYMEDWEVQTVAYTSVMAGGVDIAVTGKRPYTGEDTFLDGSTISAVKSQIASLKTPDDWGRFYWSGG